MVVMILVHCQEYSRRSHPEDLKYSKNCLVAGVLPWTLLGELTALPQTPLLVGSGIAAHLHKNSTPALVAWASVFAEDEYLFFVWNVGISALTNFENPILQRYPYWKNWIITITHKWFDRFPQFGCLMQSGFVHLTGYYTFEIFTMQAVIVHSLYLSVRSWSSSVYILKFCQK